MTHGLAAMVDRLRAGGGTGFLHGVGMFNTKHHAVVLAGRPHRGAVRGAAVRRRGRAARSRRAPWWTTTRARPPIGHLHA